MTIWKYELNLTDRQTLQIPQDAKILDVQNQNGVLTLWAMVDPDSPKEDVHIEIIGTGNPIERINNLKEKDDGTYFTFRNHLATVQMPPFVWHVFQLV